MPCVLLIKRYPNGLWEAGEPVTTLPDMPPPGCAEANTDKFFTFRVTNKTQQEMSAYLASYNFLVEMGVFQGPNGAGLRSIHVRNLNANASETLGGWTEEQTQAIRDAWNALYPECGLITLGYPSYDTWDCQGTFTEGQYTEFRDTIIEEGELATVRQRQWLISPAGMSNIEAAGGRQEGTSQQLSQILDNRVTS